MIRERQVPTSQSQIEKTRQTTPPIPLLEPEAEVIVPPEPEPSPEPEAEVGQTSVPEAETVIVTPPPQSVAELDEPSLPPVPPSPGENEVTIEQLNEAFSEDSFAADRANEGRHFTLSGIVEGVGRDLLDNPYVKLRGSDENAVLRVRCTGAGNVYEEKVAALSEGQTITVSGTYDGFLVNILLEDCTILE